MERGFFSGLSRLKGMLPGRKKGEFQLRYSLPNQEVYPSEIKQPSADYFKSLFTQFFETGLQLEEQTDNGTSNGHAYLEGQHEALGKIFTILKGEKEPKIILRNSQEGARYDKIYCSKPKPLTEEDVIKLLKIYEEYERKNERSHSFHMGACSTFRNFLIKIGQRLPANEIQTRLKKKL